MKRMIVQIYEVQNAAEAEALVSLGADHIGSVVFSAKDGKSPDLREVVGTIRKAGAKSGLIPLFRDRAALLDMLAYYRPDFVHFCEVLSPFPGDWPGTVRQCGRLLTLQSAIRKAFPTVAVMRSLSVPQPGAGANDEILEHILTIARQLAPESDCFLIDTVLGAATGLREQPVAGFVGITGKTCDWTMAARIVSESPIPVILAGGIGADNACGAALAVKPAGLDSCTRTNAVDEEGRPIRFKKDPEKVRRMVEEVRRAERILAEAENAGEKGRNAARAMPANRS